MQRNKAKVQINKNEPEPDVLPCSIRKLPSYEQHHTWRDDNTNTSSKETPAPADKPPVGQMSSSPAERGRGGKGGRGGGVER